VEEVGQQTKLIKEFIALAINRRRAQRILLIDNNVRFDELSTETDPDISHYVAAVRSDDC
jgi:hypothetical protein